MQFASSLGQPVQTAFGLASAIAGKAALANKAPFTSSARKIQLSKYIDNVLYFNDEYI
jgi:hypothetical protein